jgi:hypothetical protein
MEDTGRRKAILGSEAVQGLCTTTCLSQLMSARTTISNACSTQDIMVIDDVSYPGSFGFKFELLRGS